MSNPNWKSDRAAYRRIKEIIEEFKPDIVHTHAAKAGALGRRAAKAAGVKVIVHTFHGHVFHSYFGAVKTKLFQLIERRLASSSTGIIAISELQKKELSDTYRICKPEKIKVIPLGFDLEPFQQKRISERHKIRAKYNLSEDEVAVAIVGRLAPVKNHTLFLDVVQELAQKGIRARYFIVGDGSEREHIETRVAELKAQFGIQIEMTSWITDIAEFNAGMDVICLTSNNEGTPVSLIEAQACSIPVISTDVGGVRDIVIDGETGYVIEKNNMLKFAEKLGILISNKENREKMSQNGWNHVREKFHYNRLTNDMKKYYWSLLNK
jgi:glycosyltransferase involved in cell wall biosynthesis